MFPGPMPVETTLSHGTSIAQGLFIEMFLTAFLTITVLMLAAEKTKATFIAPVGIGLALFVAELTGDYPELCPTPELLANISISGVYFTGGSLNPARSFGPSVVNRSFPGYHWIYWLGPVFGALIASGYYKFAKYFNYEEANPGQDAASEAEASRAESRVNSRQSSGGSKN